MANYFHSITNDTSPAGWNTSRLSAPTLDWATFKKYIAPAIYRNDPRQVNQSRDAWANQLGWNTGGAGNFELVGAKSRDQFFTEKLAAQGIAPRQFDSGYGDNGGGGDDPEFAQALAAAKKRPEWDQEWDFFYAHAQTPEQQQLVLKRFREHTPLTRESPRKYLQLDESGVSEREAVAGWGDMFPEFSLPDIINAGGLPMGHAHREQNLAEEKGGACHLNCPTPTWLMSYLWAHTWGTKLWKLGWMSAWMKWSMGWKRWWA